MADSGMQLAWQPEYTVLETQLLQAHARDDKEALVNLYTQAADVAEHHNDTDAARFYLTHAYIFALDSGHSAYTSLESRLDAYHRSQDT